MKFLNYYLDLQEILDNKRKSTRKAELDQKDKDAFNSAKNLRK